MPANTGKAGAIHRVCCFAGTPAPTGQVQTNHCRLRLLRNWCFNVFNGGA